jgi:hypothetical protein
MNHIDKTLYVNYLGIKVITENYCYDETSQVI